MRRFENGVADALDILPGIVTQKFSLLCPRPRKLEVGAAELRLERLPKLELSGCEGTPAAARLSKLLADAAAGSVYSDGGLTTTVNSTWQPRSVKPMLEHYFEMPLTDLETAYLRYVRKIAGSGAES